MHSIVTECVPRTVHGLAGTSAMQRPATESKSAGNRWAVEEEDATAVWLHAYLEEVLFESAAGRTTGTQPIVVGRNVARA